MTVRKSVSELTEAELALVSEEEITAAIEQATENVINRPDPNTVAKEDREMVVRNLYRLILTSAAEARLASENAPKAS